MIRRLWTNRDLVMSLVRRNYQVRYRQSLVGMAWAVVPPLVTVAAATLVFHRVAGVDTGSVPYPLFAFAALAPWTFLANSLTVGATSVTAIPGMVTRMAFPKAALPISMTGTSLIDLAISCLTFVAFAYVTGAGLPITALWFPLLVVVEIVLALGVVLFLSAMNVFVRDVRLAVPFVAQLWLFLTPVMYPLSDVPPGLRDLYMLNPMTGLVESFREVLIYGNPPNAVLLAPACIGAAVALVIGSWYFGATEKRFADVI